MKKTILTTCHISVACLSCIGVIMGLDPALFGVVIAAPSIIFAADSALGK